MMKVLKFIIYFTIFNIEVICQKDGYFLPESVKPLRYIVTLEPLSQTNYRGSVSIELQVLENTSNITLHAKSLEIPNESIKIRDVYGNEVLHKDTISDEEKDFFVIILETELQRGRVYRLTIENYQGTFTDSKIGFYIEKFESLHKSEGFIALSDFEPTYAREAFPCFDEPHLKATFIVNLIRSSSSISASNSPLVETLYLGNDRYQDVYKETPPMSTYIVAFIVCNMKYTRQNGKIRLLVRPQFTEEETDFVLTEAANVLDAMEKYTGIKYLPDKLDIVGVVNKVGGMENWGLITFDEQYVICPNENARWNIQTCLTYNSHEISHQWFGNLVTLKSWHYMWLNEGFATYFQYFIAHVLRPSWRLDEQYVVEEFQRSLREDLLPLTEPMDFIFEESFMFPAAIISYQKASAVIRMTKHILTETVFQKGLRLYLNTYQLRVTEPKNLYDCYLDILHMEGKTHLVGGLDLQTILSNWAKSSGYPIVSVIRHYTTGDVTFSQQVNDLSGDSEDNIWYIPLTFTFQNKMTFENTITDLWMTNKSVTVGTGEPRGWMLVNKHAAGYYRVAYDNQNWKRLTEFLYSRDYELIPAVNRAQLIDDAFFFFIRDKLDTDIFLNLTSYLAKEQDYIPIKSYLTNLDIMFELNEIRRNDKEIGIIKGYLITLLKTTFDGVGLYARESDTHIDKLKREEIMKTLCTLGDFRCRLQSLRMLTEWKTTGKPLRNYDMEMWLCAAMQKPTVELWSFLVEQYSLTDDDILRQKYLRALSCANSVVFKQRFLGFVFDLHNNMQSQERTDGLASFIRNTFMGAKTLIKYIKDKQLDDRLYSLFRNSTERYLLMPSEIGKMLTAEDRKILIRLCVLFVTDEENNEKAVRKLVERFPKYF